MASVAAAEEPVAKPAAAAQPASGGAPAGGPPGGFPAGGFPGGAGGFPGGGVGGFPAGGFPGFGGGDGVAPWLKDRLPPADGPKPSADPRNLEGSYLNFKMGGMGGAGPDYTDEYKSKASQTMTLSSGGRPQADLPASCRPAGQVQAFNANFPFVVIQSDKYVLLLQEESHALVRIHMNQPLPKTVKTSYEGYSVGHWDGNTLVAETIGIDDRTHLGMMPVKHSSTLHLTTRIRKTDKGDLEFTWIADDPKAFKTPYKSGPAVHTWAPNVNQLSEYDCEEQMGSKDYATRYGMKEEK